MHPTAPLRPIRDFRLAALLVGVLAASAASAATATDRMVVVMLFDGLAPDLVTANATPNLDRMAERGAWTHDMVPAFPTTSLINGFTISTGCWPESHGVVANRFRDPERGEYDHSRDADWATGCEHLHEAAERQGVRSAALDWYGATSTTRGELAAIVDHHEHFTDFPTDAERAARVVELLALPATTRPRLILGYFRGPDASAHFAGMEADETRRDVRASDAAVGVVLDAIAKHPERERISLLVTTDHGMIPVDTIVNVTRILRRHDIPAKAISDGSASYLYFDDPAAIEPARRALSTYREFEVYAKQDLPAWARIGRGPRVGDLVLSAPPPYFTADVELWPWFARWLGSYGPDFVPALGNLYATHGYPPETPGVHGVLYAEGAGIAIGHHLERVHAVDIHPTLTHLLGIDPGRPVDGSVAHELLRYTEWYPRSDTDRRRAP